MRHRAVASQQRFSNRPAQVVGALYSGLIVFLGLATLAEEPSSRGFAVVMVLFGVFFVFRALHSSDVVVDESGVITRSIVRTRHYAFSELRGVEVAVGQTGMTGFGREYLVFHRADGRDVSFKEFNCRPSKGDEPSVVHRAAACINERLLSP